MATEDDPRRAYGKPADAPQRRLQPRGVATGDSRGEVASPHRSVPRHREEVAGRGPGGTAGGPPATATGEDDATAFDPARLDREGDLSNTPSQKTTHPQALTTGGEDWLTVNFYVNHADFERTASTLDAAQAAAAEGDDGAGELQLGDLRWIVGPGGARQGAGPKALHMRWRLESEQGLTLLLMNRAGAHPTQPNAIIRAGSLLLMRRGLDAVWGMMRYALEQLGCEIVGDKLSRVDVCVDLSEIPVAMFCDPLADDWFVTRAKSRAEHGISSFASGKQPTGFSVGKSPLLLRVYDKLREASNDPLKLAVIEAHRWGGRPRAATRVEFQIGRAKLKTMGVDTVADWREKRADIVERLTTGWFRLTEGPVDRNHASRAPTHPLWELASGRFSEWLGQTAGADLAPLPTLQVDVRQRVSAAVGVFVGVFARAGYDFTNNEHFIREVVTELRECVRKRDLRGEVRRKALELGVEGL